ncbi:MAG: SAM-dependent methyltransferase [Pseudomonadota bacterium]
MSFWQPLPLARSLDQFFTRPDVARLCVESLKPLIESEGGDWLWIEPSAGGGAFLDQLPYPRVALDIAPGRPDIEETDFLHWQPGIVQRRIAVVGNPPFGKNASLARRFFDHAAQFADIIAFILPRTFEKDQFVNRLNRSMHLIHSHLLDELSFELEGEPYAVPTVFQIWEKRPFDRALVCARRTHQHFDFVASSMGHFAFQRVGARAGMVSREGLRKSPQSHYYLRANICEKTLYDRLRSIDWTPIKYRTAGNPSIGKAELIQAYQSVFG